MFWAIKYFLRDKQNSFGPVVVAQLVERLIPTSEVCGQNAVIGKLLNILIVYWIERTKYER